mmetsp:Transcript_25472/g.39262  ORF Transcript_25472/g.39262 Transcript_25472/m.39262 type:complete len:117 (+) Transcript_25472:871-1221(+)
MNVLTQIILLLLQSQLDVQAIKQKEFLPRLCEMDPMASMKDLLSHLEPHIKAKDMNVTLANDEKNPVPDQIIFDPGRFKQTLFLILTNAFKYTEEAQRHIKVTMSLKDPADGELSH